MIAIEWLKEKTGFQRIPPICYPLVAPFFAIFFICLGCYIATRWLFGCWTCDYCERKYGTRDERFDVKFSYYEYEETYHKCLACSTAEKLTGSELPLKKG